MITITDCILCGFRRKVLSDRSPQTHNTPGTLNPVPTIYYIFTVSTINVVINTVLKTI